MRHASSFTRPRGYVGGGSNAAAVVGDSVQLGTRMAEVVGVLEAGRLPQSCAWGPGVAPRRLSIFAPLEFVPGALNERTSPAVSHGAFHSVEQTTPLSSALNGCLRFPYTAWKSATRSRPAKVGSASCREES